MTRRLIAFYSATALLFSLGLGFATPTNAQILQMDNDVPDVDGGNTSFEVGSSCAALAYLSTAELKTLVNVSYSDDFHSFCYPEEPSDCSDYTSFLRGLGRLTTGDDGYHCSLQVQL